MPENVSIVNTREGRPLVSNVHQALWLSVHFRRHSSALQPVFMNEVEETIQ